MSSVPIGKATISINGKEIGQFDATIKHSAVKERPILFRAQMVRAILRSDKTQTRRVAKNIPPAPDRRNFDFDPGEWISATQVPGNNFFLKTSPFRKYENSAAAGVVSDLIRCPYGIPGDRLWVRETWVYRSKHDKYYYRADWPSSEPYCHDGWKPSIHLPRKACRLVLEITEVRLEKLQFIKHDDAVAEGVKTWMLGLERDGLHDPDAHLGGYPVTAFARMWDRSNAGTPKAWDKDPWVWVVEFKRI